MGLSEEEKEAAALRTKAPPVAILVPPRASMESLFTYGFGGLGFSPGPITLVSSFFNDQGPSSLLASPQGLPQQAEAPEIKVDDERIAESSGGYKRNRPTSLAVAPSTDSLNHLLMIPAGMTPSGMLTSPGFLSPLQSPFAISHQQALALVTAQAAFSDTCAQMQNQGSLSPPHSGDAFVSLIETGNPKMEAYDVSQPEIKAAAPAEAGNAGSDGYNWRKYGQKNVKATEFPRSYYRCSYGDCPVRKKVETSIDGSISEIIYKGQHNHDPPQAGKLRKDHIQSKSVPAVSRAVIGDSFGIPGVKNETKESVIVLVDEEDELPDAKRRNMESEKLVPRTSTEFKIVVQTRSEVDLLDDGYKWRKYGQKIVKGRTYPRSYYKCTFAGCNVRKQVERASSDQREVTTTYEGKHNHEIPAGKHGIYPDLKPQKTAAADPSKTSEMDSTSNNQIPATLYLKEERVVA